jgi:hypothetical protein
LSGASRTFSSSSLTTWFRAGPERGFEGLPPLARWDAPIRRILPIAFAAHAGLVVAKFWVVPAAIGYDARLYAAAARAWLQGGDPWAVSDGGVLFSAPPPTLIPMVPLTPLPDVPLSAVVVIGSFALALAAVRSLGLPLWWVLFSPIIDGVMLGNPDVAVLAALVVLGRRFDVIAPLLKVYALAPLAADRRWRTIGLFALIVLVSVLVLPWGRWIAAGPLVQENLQRFATTTSVYGSLPLMIVAIVALLSMGVRRAGWLAVPVLWPWTQPHYLAMSTPAVTPLLALVGTLPLIPPPLMLGTIVVVAVGARWFPAAAEARPETRHALPLVPVDP